MSDRELSRFQAKALTALVEQAEDGEFAEARVVGWDSACKGPLVRLEEGCTFAISTRGRLVERNPA